MVERDVQRVVGRRREPGLEADVIAAAVGARFFEAKIFLKNPKQLGRETAFGEDFFPGVERFGQRRTIKRLWLNS